MNRTYAVVVDDETGRELRTATVSDIHRCADADRGVFSDTLGRKVRLVGVAQDSDGDYQVPRAGSRFGAPVVVLPDAPYGGVWVPGDLALARIGIALSPEAETLRAYIETPDLGNLLGGPR